MKNEERENAKGGLFFRIMLQLTLPLILLATLLTALEVNNQFRSLNKFHLAQGQWVFTSMQEKLHTALPASPTDEQLTALDKKLKSQAPSYNLAGISMFDYLKRTPINPEDSWEPFDFEQIEKSILDAKSRSKPYLVMVNRETRQINAYIPVIKSSSSIYIVKASIGLSDFKEAVSQSKHYLMMMMIFIMTAGIIIGFNLSGSIVKPILLLNQASSEIIRGKLGRQVLIETGDEIEVLSHTFNHMSSAATRVFSAS